MNIWQSSPRLKKYSEQWERSSPALCPLIAYKNWHNWKWRNMGRLDSMGITFRLFHIQRSSFVRDAHSENRAVQLSAIDTDCDTHFCGKQIACGSSGHLNFDLSWFYICKDGTNILIQTMLTQSKGFPCSHLEAITERVSIICSMIP